MAKRRHAPASWVGATPDETRAGFFAAMCNEARQKFTSGLTLGTEAEQDLVGLPLPALCLRYLFQSTVFPLSRVVQITGEEGSCKSSLLYEIFRWHMVHGGGACFIENENKDSPELRNSILQYNPAWLQCIDMLSTYALEDWQEGLTMFITLAAKLQDMEGGCGRTLPVAFGLDSIMATGPREEIKKILKEGHAARNFALGAYLISQYMRCMPELIKKYPFTIIGTNHLKPSTDYMGRPTNTVPGGKSVKFYETYEIEMKRAPSADIDLLDYGGIRLSLTCRKNSLGPSRKKIVAELLWWNSRDPYSDCIRQQTAWDWDTASVELLLGFENISGKKTIYNELMEICPITRVSRSRREAACPVLGLNDVVPYRVIGSELERRPDLLNPIYAALNILPRKVFQPGMDYRAAIEQAVEEARLDASSRYQHIEGLPQVDPDILDPSHTAVVPEEEGDVDDGMVDG